MLGIQLWNNKKQQCARNHTMGSIIIIICLFQNSNFHTTIVLSYSVQNEGVYTRHKRFFFLFNITYFKLYWGNNSTDCILPGIKKTNFLHLNAQELWNQCLQNSNLTHFVANTTLILSGKVFSLKQFNYPDLANVTFQGKMTQITQWLNP